MGGAIASPVVLGAGPVGLAVVSRLVERGLHPVVVSRSGTGPAGTQVLAVDITDAKALRAAIDGADVVFQCAQPAYHRWAQEFPGLQGSVVDACADVGALVVAVENLYGHGHPAGPITEASPLAPDTAKGRVRAALGQDLIAAHNSGRVRAAAVRASDFFGPGVAQSAYGERCFGPLANGGKAEILGRPDVLHSATYVPDFAEALVRVAERPDCWGRAWFAPTAPAVTQQELVALAAGHLGVTPRVRPVGATMLRLVGMFNPGARETVEMLGHFTADYVVDTSHSEAALGMVPTPLHDALAATVAAYRRP